MSKKRDYYSTSIFFVKTILCILLVFNIVFFAYYWIITQKSNHKETNLRFIESWTVTDNEGNSVTSGRSYMTKQNNNKVYTITSVLPDDIKDNEYLFFSIRKDIAVYINGVLRYDFIEDRDINIPGGAVKPFYASFPLNSDDSGAEIRMENITTVKDGQVAPESFIGTRYESLSYLMQIEGLSFVLAITVLIFSFVILIISIVLRFWYRMQIDMLYGSLGIFILAFWIATDTFICCYLSSIPHLIGVINYVICLMIPLSPCIYLNAVQRGRYRKIMSFLMVFTSVNAVIWPVLHFTGLVPFYSVRTIINTTLASMAVAAIAVLIYDAVKRRIREYRYTFIGFFGFLVCCLIELLRTMLTKSVIQSVFMIMGLAFLLVFIVIQQVDDIRKINQERQHAIDISEAKTKFLASMSHEIRTPINAILGMNEMILRENNDAVIDDYARSIKTSGKMLLMLVNDVLDFSKIEAGKLEINENKFVMSDMLRDVLSLVKERADEKNLELKTEIIGDVPNEIISDEFRIRQVLINLLNNAVKYTEKGTVTLIIGGSYTDKGFDLKLKVKDTGKGIRKEDQAALFEAFSRADIKSNANIEGTGLGLAIVKSIVNSMNGLVDVDSEYGKGSEFSVSLPVRFEGNDKLNGGFMDHRASYENETEAESFTARDAKILAVDDNQSNLTIVKLFLKRTGIVPDICTSGLKALELCRENRYDLILLDHMMPEPDGIETLHMIRNDARSLNKDTKAIVLTANAVAGSRQMYLAEGFEDYLTKPLDSKILEQTIRNMLPREKIVSTETKAAPQENVSALKSRLTEVEGLDYQTALSYCGDSEEMLEEIIGDVIADCPVRAAKMRKDLEAGDLKSYRIEAHTIKSTMATIGLNSLSERAKQHEFAAADENTDFINPDAEAFINEYESVCEKLKTQPFR